MTTIDPKALALRVADVLESVDEAAVIERQALVQSVAEARALAAFLREAVGPAKEAEDWRERDLDLIAQHEKAEAFKAGVLAGREMIVKRFAKVVQDSEKYMKQFQAGSPAWNTHANNATEAGRVITLLRTLPLLTPPAAGVRDA